MKDVMHAGKDVVIERRKWHRDFGWEPRQGVTDASLPCVPKPNGVASVRLEGRASEQSIRAVGATMWCAPWT